MAPSPESSPASTTPPTKSTSTPSSSPPPPSKTSPPPPLKTSPPPPSKTSPPPPPEENPSPPPTRKSPPPPSEESPPPPSESPPPPAKNPSSTPEKIPPPPTKSPPPPDASPPPPPTRDKPPSVSKPPPSTTSATPLPKSPPSTTKGSPPSSISTSATPSSTNSLPNLSPTISLAANNSSLFDSLATARANSTTPSGHKDGHGARFGVVIGVLSAVLVIGLIMAIIFLRLRKKKGRQSSYLVPSRYNASPGLGPNDSGGEYSHLSPDHGIVSPKAWFTYDELSSSTNGFSPQNILGSGGFGSVYKGYLEDGREVAVKKLKVGSGQGDREFKAEVEIISRVHHRHLVTLVGYCISDHQRLLIYEFVPNNTLENHLHGSSLSVMKWSLRVKVATGSAKGIAYLHEDCHPRIIHRDIKSANILLENNFEAKVADFGLAKLAEELEANTHVSTRVMGTFGYMAPEYATSGKLTEKSDVFSFGVVLLELITGRKSVDKSQPVGEESLVEWARPLMTKALDTEDFDELADVRMEGDYVPAEMFRMIEAAAACVRHSAPRRPKMSQVARALDSLGESSTDLTNGMRPGQSTIFDTREQSAQIRMFQRMAFDDNSAEYNNSKAGWSGTAGWH